MLSLSTFQNHRQYRHNKEYIYILGSIVFKLYYDIFNRLTSANFELKLLFEKSNTDLQYKIKVFNSKYNLAVKN